MNWKSHHTKSTVPTMRPVSNNGLRPHGAQAYNIGLDNGMAPLQLGSLLLMIPHHLSIINPAVRMLCILGPRTSSIPLPTENPSPMCES